MYSPPPRLILLVSLVMASTAMAQDQSIADWEVSRNPELKAIAAGAEFSNGISIGLRCVDNGLAALMGGLPAIEAEERRIGIAFGDDPIVDQTWNVAVDSTVAVSELPAPFARRVREGGRLQVRIAGAGEGGRNLRYVIDLPPSTSAIDQTLAACGRPLVDPRDAELEAIGDTGLPSNLEWRQRPRPGYPTRTRYAKGFAVISCLTAGDGSLRDCVVEAEHPRDGGFGQSALSATRRGRLRNVLNPDAPIPLERILFRTKFYLEGYQPRGMALRTGSRLPTPTRPELD